MADNDITLLINSCDAYEDILDTFFELLHRFWPDLKYDIVLSTESLEYKNKYFNIKNVHPKDKKCSWSRRIYEALETIKSKQVLFLLDDFFIYDYVKNEEITKCSEYLSKDEDIVNFTYWPIMNGTRESDINGYFIRTANEKHKIAAIAALWNKKQFMKYIGNLDEDIWEFEINGTIRSNTLYPNDKFYCLDHTNDVIPYDFAKYGLISGKWFDATRELFEKLKIECDFSKRGIFNEALYGLNRSFISSFRIEPYVIPNYSVKKFNPQIQYKEVFPTGEFKFEFDLKNATDLIRLTLTEQRGFAVEDLKIQIVYKDNENEIVSEDSLFGNFIIIDGKLVFNTETADISIPLKESKKAIKINVKGRSICPIDEKLLLDSYNKKTQEKNEKYRVLNQLFNLDRDVNYLDVKNIKLNPKLDGKRFIQCRKVFNIYRYKFEISNPDEHVETLVLSSKCYYSIKSLKIINNEGKVCTVKNFPPEYEKEYIFLFSGKIEINIPANTDKLYVEFKLTSPIDKIFLAKSSNIL